MVSQNYAKAYKEIIEILKYTKKSDVKKIPKEKIILWKTNMDKDWNFTVDTNKNLEDQNILSETRAIIANIFYDYWATDYQKQRIDEKDKKNSEIQEMQKREKYNPDNIFKDKHISSINNTSDISEQNKSLTLVKKDSWYNKLFRKLHNIFKRKNISSINNENYKNNLQKLIDDNYGIDPFWRDILNSYFEKVTKSEIEKINFLSNLIKDTDLFNEFTKEIVTLTNVDEIFEKYKNITEMNIDKFYKKM